MDGRVSDKDFHLTLFWASWLIVGAVVGTFMRLWRGYQVTVADLLGAALLGYLIVLAEIFLLLGRIKIFK